MDITSNRVTLYGRWSQTSIKQYFVGVAAGAGSRAKQAGGAVGRRAGGRGGGGGRAVNLDTSNICYTKRELERSSGRLDCEKTRRPRATARLAHHGVP